jgi:hypothetical protein
MLDEASMQTPEHARKNIEQIRTSIQGSNTQVHFATACMKAVCVCVCVCVCVYVSNICVTVANS